MDIRCINSIINNAINNAISNDSSESDILGIIDNEVEWNSDELAFAVQSDIKHNTEPYYRYPLTNMLIINQFTPTINRIKLLVEEFCDIKLNHATLKKYKSDGDFILNHVSEKINIVPDSKIVNIVIGGNITMEYQHNCLEEINKITLYNNSALITNYNIDSMYKMSVLCNPEIKQPTIIITFRTINTFMDARNEC